MADPKPCNLISQQKVFYLTIGQAASCCKAQTVELDNKKSIREYIEHWKEQKNLLDQGVQISQCGVCWKNESQNLISFRQQYQQSNFDNTYELSISNACNQMCSYCSPRYSSTWQKSIETFGSFKNISASAQHNQQLLPTSVNIDYWVNEIRTNIAESDDQSVTIKLLGGEPLMQNKNLQRLLELDSNKIKKLTIITNLAPPDNKFLKLVLKSFPADSLEFLISLDTTPEFNHVPRGNFKSREFNQNLLLVQASGAKIQIIPVISVLSVFDLVKFIPWLGSKRIDYVFQKLNNPDCLDPTLIPVELRQRIYNRLVGQELPALVTEVLTQQGSSSSVRLFEQYNYLTQYFERVNIEVSSIKNSLFQEYWTWLSSKYSKNLSTYS